MTHTYQVSGMTCSACPDNVKTKLYSIPGVKEVIIDKEKNTASITMERHIPLAEFNNSFAGSKYSLAESPAIHKPEILPDANEEPITFKTYLPIFLIFAYILGVTLIIQLNASVFSWHTFMAHFMSGFFLVFSFFKLLDVPAFAMSYSSYDIVAKRIYGYGYVYPFLELAIGISFLFPKLFFYSNLFTFILMSVSIIGVIQSMLRKSNFQCACLGAVFKLPLSKVTLFEDALMIVMSFSALIALS